MRQFLASAFAWNISVRSMQACASVFASCSLLPPRILYYKPWIRVYARKNVLPDPRKSQNRVSDGKLYLSDPQNNKMVDITAMQKRKTGLRRQIVSPRPATTQNAVFITSFSAASSQNQFFITSFSYCNRSGISFHRSHRPQFLPHGPHVLPHSDHG